MDGNVYANLYTSESTISSSTDITFPWRSRKIILTNDSSVNDLTVTFQGSTLTLKPQETLTLYIWIDAVTLNSTGASYRLWVIG